MMFFIPHTGDDRLDFLMPLIMGGLMLAMIVGAVVFVAFDMDGTRARQREFRVQWDGAQVVKICRNGTYIWKLRDGTHWTGGFPSQVPGPNVCD